MTQYPGHVYSIKFVSHLGGLYAYMCVSHSEDSLSPGAPQGILGGRSPIPTPITVLLALCHFDALAFPNTHTRTNNTLLDQVGGGHTPTNSHRHTNLTSSIHPLPRLVDVLNCTPLKIALSPTPRQSA